MSFAQGEISLSVENVDLKTLLVEIEKKSDIRFTYLNQLSDTNKDISLAVTNKTVEEILNLVLSKKGMEFTRTGNTIAIQMRSSQNRQTAPTKKVTGIVTDSNGEPIIGANVSVKGTTTGTITDIDGHFSLEAIQGQTILVSFIGYSSKEIDITDKSSYQISMSDDTQNLDEVVVIGYGTVRKKDLTGAVGSVKSEDMMQRPSTSISQSISGRIAGVNISSNSGRPGGNQTIRIRGYSSINATNEPLYIIDGVPGDINILNPNDIESVEVLKDASSTAIYGTRGSNGVIVVTTKRGKNEITVNYNTYLSLNTVAKKLDVLNAEQFLAVEDMIYANAKKFDPNGFASGKYIDPSVKRQDYLVGNTKGKRELFKMEGGNLSLCMI